MNKIWKDVSLTPYYEVSNYGEVRNKGTKKILKGSPDKDGYIHVTLRLGLDKYKTPSVHRLVAQAFIPNDNNLPCVNHKDENKQNNRANNLEWCSIAYNNAYGTGREKAIKSNKERNGKKVKAIKDGKEFIFASRQEATKVLGLNKSSLYMCLKNKISQTHGYKIEEVIV